MKILLIGSGGREHAIYNALMNCGANVIAMPGNPGMKSIKNESLEKVLNKEHFDLVFFGPEAPLAEGEADLVRSLGIAAFGPGKKGAMLETSKAFSKEFMKKYDIPCAESQIVTSKTELLEKAKLPIVLKADGLASGKGVFLPETIEELEEAASDFFDSKLFGDTKVLLEERLEGPEVSLFYLFNHTGYFYLGNARDHKRAFDGDEGPNTGGMGTVSPVTLSNEEKEQAELIANKTFEGLKQEQIDYRGVIFIGCMRTKDGLKVLEYNVRFGDPETQVLLPLLKENFLDLVVKTAHNQAYEIVRKEPDETAICVVIASEGYPQKPIVGKTVTISDNDEISFLIAGLKDQDGTLVTSGGRVFSLVAKGKTIESARERVYKNIHNVHFDGMWYRKDIGK